MSILHTRAALVAAVGSLLLAGPAPAASSASSAASESASASVGSVSTSFERSSDSSTRGNHVAAGDYRVVEIVAATDRGRAGRTDQMRLKLQAVAGSGAEGEFFLYLPHEALAQGTLVGGAVVGARTRPYGVEFVHGKPPQAFFLLMADDWYRELRTQVVAG